MSEQDTTRPGGALYCGGTVPGVVRVRVTSGKVKTLDAVAVAIEGPWVNATGVWRDDPFRQRRSYTFGPRQLVEIRWAP